MINKKACVFGALLFFANYCDGADKEITRGEKLIIEWRDPYTDPVKLENVMWYSVAWQCDTDISGESEQFERTTHSFQVDTQAVYGECVFRIVWGYNCTPTESIDNIYESAGYTVLIKLPKPARGGFRKWPR